MDEHRTIIVCKGVDCRARGSEKLLSELKERLAEAPGGDEVAVQTYVCFGGCKDGPNMVVFPDRIWYAGVSQEDIPDIAAHLVGGSRVDRLTGKIDPALESLVFDLLAVGVGEF